MTDELRNKILAYNRRIKADRAERDELQAKLDRIRDAVDSMTGLPSVSKLAAFLETIREIIKPAKEGTGLVAGGAARAILELAGVKDVVSKSLGSNTKVNVAKATLEALKSQRSKEHIAELRGKKVEEL